MENGLITTKVHNFGGVNGCVRDHSLDCDVASYFGRPTNNPRRLLDDTLLYGTAAANPQEGVFFAVTAWDAIGAAISTTNFDVLIEYDAYFWEPRKLPVS